jgi:hypothetical protein
MQERDTICKGAAELLDLGGLEEDAVVDAGFAQGWVGVPEVEINTGSGAIKVVLASVSDG